MAIHQILKRHRNIVVLHKSFLDVQQNFYLFLEYCESDLQKYLDGDPENILSRFYEGTCSGLFGLAIRSIGRSSLSRLDPSNDKRNSLLA